MNMNTVKTANTKPRPHNVGEQWALSGVYCRTCTFASVLDTRRCPRCSGEIEARDFGPEGTIWSHATVRIPFNGRPVPYDIAYVDLDGGARVLVHPSTPARIDGRVRLTGVTDAGDITAEALA